VACKFGETEVEVDIDEDSGDYVCVIPERPSEFTNRDLTLSFQLIRLDTGEPLHENDLFIFYSNNVNDTLIQPILLQTCEDCGQFRAECTRDCSGVWNGPADIDDCGDCYGGDTGKVAGSNKDCHGICGGPFADDWPEYLDISHPDLDLKGCGCQITGEHCDLYQTAPGSVSVLETWKLLDDVQLTFLLMATISSVCIVVTAAIVAFRRARHPRIFVSNDDPVVVEEHDPNEGLASDEE
jgi:hypothetical protein